MALHKKRFLALVLLSFPLLISCCSRSASHPPEAIGQNYFLNIKGAGKSGIVPDDVTHIVILTENAASMAAGMFVKQIAQENNIQMFVGMPSDTDKHPLAPPVYVRFADKRADGTQFMVMSRNARRLASATTYATSALFRITDTQWVNGNSGHTLLFFVKAE